MYKEQMYLKSTIQLQVVVFKVFNNYNSLTKQILAVKAIFLRL